MANYFFGENISNLLNYSMATLLILNLLYILYAFVKHKVYYGNSLISCAIYFSALCIDPISVSIKFNSKYGYEAVELIYMLVIFYIIIMAIISNNNYMVYNMKWKDLKNNILDFLESEGKESYLFEDTIYIGNDDVTIKKILLFFSGYTSIVRVKRIESIFDKKKFDAKMIAEKKYEKPSRFYYLLLNLVITIVLLLNLRY